MAFCVLRLIRNTHLWPSTQIVASRGCCYVHRACIDGSAASCCPNAFRSAGDLDSQAIQLANSDGGRCSEEDSSSDVAPLAEILGRKGWSEDTVKCLRVLNVRITAQLMVKVLRLKLHPDVAVGFFRWAGWQDGYEHDFKVYYKMMVVLGRKKRFGDLDWLLEEMDRRGLMMNEIVFSTLIRLYGRAGKLKKAFQAFGQMESCGLFRSAIGCTNMLLVLLKAERYKAMDDVYKRILASRLPLDTNSFNALIEGFCKRGRIEDAEELLSLMKTQGCVPSFCTYILLIRRLCRARRFEEAYELLTTMLKEACVSDIRTFNEVVKAFCKRRNFLVGYQAFQTIVKSGCVPGVSTFHVLIRSALRARDADRAINCLGEMKNMDCVPDSLTYNTLINGLCQARQPDKAYRMLRKMERNVCIKGCQPYNTVIESFLKAGKVEKAHDVLNWARSKGYVLERFVFYSVIDHLFLSGKVPEAQALLKYFEDQSCVSGEGC